ncbi:MAG: TraU family protein [Parachlamydiaceae bacterium]
MKAFIYLAILFHASIYGAFINPITDVCWECLFPITVSGVNVTPGEKDFAKYNQHICSCAGRPPIVGIPLSFWEPLKMVDVTMDPYKLVGLGGITLGNSLSKNRGYISYRSETNTQGSFYHVHFYQYPLLSMLNLLTDFLCVEKGGLDVAYMSEYDPSWNDSTLSLILEPEGALFSSPLAQLSCTADCTMASFNKVENSLFWCAGCQGSLYPFQGTVEHHVSPLQASSLLVHRVIAKLHRCGFIKGYHESEFCSPSYMPIIKKSLYKTQLVHPIPQTKGPCQPLGKSDVLWGFGKNDPFGGREFVYLVWVKKQCCLDAVKPLVLPTVAK